MYDGDIEYEALPGELCTLPVSVSFCGYLFASQKDLLFQKLPVQVSIEVVSVNMIQQHSEKGIVNKTV